MPALFARVKVWGPNETVEATDLNGEFNNILNNLTPAGVDDLSATISNMQQTFDPGNVGSENQPQSLAQEVQALRSMVQKMTGEDQWYIPPEVNLSALSASVASASGSAVLSGSINANNFPNFFEITGGSLVLTLSADTTDFVYTVRGVQYTLSSDLTRTVTAGPSSANTATINDTENNGGRSKDLGEDSSVIRIDAVGAEFVSRINKLVAFSYTQGADTELSIGVLRQDSIGYYLENCFRGFFFDGTGATSRNAIVDNGTLTLRAINYIYVNSSSQLLSSTSDPYIQGDEPTGVSLGDRWFDLNEKRWKVYDGAVFNNEEISYVGMVITSSTEIVGIRPIDFQKSRSPVCDLSVERISDTEAGARVGGGSVNVEGTNANYRELRPSWDMTSDLDAGETEAASKWYYLYLTDEFSEVISEVKPFNRQYDLKGRYHPSKPWRCIGAVYNNASSNISQAVTYGSESYLANHSISSEKLRPLALIDQDAAGGSTLAEPLTNSDTVNAIRIAFAFSGTEIISDIAYFVSTGRPVLITTDSAVAGSNVTFDTTGGTTPNTLIDIEYRKIGSSTWITAGSYGYRHEPAAAARLVIPFIAQQTIFPSRGQYEMRAKVSGSGGAGGNISFFGRLIAREV